jgi:DNA-binding transcriptional LysR family regulator
MVAARQRIDMIRHLEFFVAVAEELHFGRAADAVGVSQPPLSQGLQRLERRLGTALFERGSRGVRLTPAGSLLLPHARTILDEVGVLLAVAADNGQRPVGLRMGVAPQVGTATVAALVSAARPAVADRRIELVTAPSARLVADVADGRIGAAVITHPAPLAGVRGGPVVRIPTRLLISADHSLTQRNAASIGLRDLARELPLALPPREHHPAVHDQMLDVMARFGVRLSGRCVEDDRSAVLIAAAGSAAALTTDVTLSSAAVVNLAVDGDPLPLRLRLVHGFDGAAPPAPAVLDTMQRTLERERDGR